MNTAGLSAALLIHLKDFSSFRRLKGVRAVAEGDIKVVVQHGWIALEGEVGWQYQKETVERLVRKLSGVLGIDNWLTLRPRVDAGEIQRSIEAALKRNAEVEADGIHVKVQGDVVILEGRGHFWRQRHVAERSGW